MHFSQIFQPWSPPPSVRPNGNPPLRRSDVQIYLAIYHDLNVTVQDVNELRPAELCWDLSQKLQVSHIWSLLWSKRRAWYNFLGIICRFFLNIYIFSVFYITPHVNMSTSGDHVSRNGGRQRWLMWLFSAISRKTLAQKVEPKHGLPVLPRPIGQYGLSWQFVLRLFRPPYFDTHT